MYKRYVIELNLQSEKCANKTIPKRKGSSYKGLGHGLSSGLEGNRIFTVSAVRDQSAISSFRPLPLSKKSDKTKKDSPAYSNTSSTANELSSVSKDWTNVSSKEAGLLRRHSNASPWASNRGVKEIGGIPNSSGTSAAADDDIRNDVSTNTCISAELRSSTHRTDKKSKGVPDKSGTLVVENGKQNGAITATCLSDECFASPAYEHEDEFVVYYNRKVQRFCVCGFKSNITAQKLINYVQKRGATVTWVTFFRVHNSDHVTIRLNIKVNTFVHRLTHEGFWPKNITCRPWQPRTKGLLPGNGTCSRDRYGQKTKFKYVDIDDYENY